MLSDAARDMIRVGWLHSPAVRKDRFCQHVAKSHPLQFLYAQGLALTEHGFRVTLEVVGTQQNCNKGVVVPYSVLRPYLDAQEAKRLQWRQ